MIAFLVALLLWALGHGPTPALSPVHGDTVSAPAPATVAPAPRSQTARVPHSSAALASSAAPATATVAVNGEELQGPVMCTDPVSCPTDQPPTP